MYFKIDACDSWLPSWSSSCMLQTFANKYDYADSEIVMVDLGFGIDFFEQDRSWDDFGILWDDHFMDLGHSPKFYRVQDAGFIGGSSI